MDMTCSASRACKHAQVSLQYAKINIYILAIVIGWRNNITRLSTSSRTFIFKTEIRCNAAHFLFPELYSIHRRDSRKPQCAYMDRMFLFMSKSPQNN